MAGMLGLFLAPNFATAMLVNFFTGTGRAMVLIMVLSLIGELLPLEKRGWAVGLTVSAIMFAFVSVPLLSASIAEVAGWRSVLLWFILPVSIACFSLALFTVPSKPSLEQSPAKLLYSEAFKKIFFNKSAIACLVGTTLLTLVGVVPVYAVSFYRIDFSVSTMTGGMFASVAAAGGILGGVGSGRLINRFGRKPLTFVAALVSAAFAILFTFMPQMWISVAFWVVSATATAMASAALRSLILEQVPMFRGSMMSVNQSFEYVGTILVVALGGLILNLYSNNFQLLMTIFGSFGIAGGLIVFLLATDPCKPA
jgi:MFS family permease